jgi:hypothetical protein
VDQSCLGDAKVAVVTSLQSRLVRRTTLGIATEREPGSRASAIIERAIDYALSSRRTQSEAAFLEHDVLHDADLAIRRAADSEARGLAAIATLCAPDHVAFDGRVDSNTYSLATENRGPRSPSVRTCGPAAKVAGTAIVSAITPEDVAVANDLERRLRAAVRSALGALASAVLDGMLDGESVPEIARRLSVSTRTVTRARDKIRTLAKTVLGVDGVAA